LSWTPEQLDVLPRLGWAQAPTPITPLPELAAELGLDWFGVKRDDLADGLEGSTKTRKLDFLLAEGPLADAPVWASVGAIGSGHLAALSLAATKLERRLVAHTFFEPPSPDVLTNLACIVSGPTTLRYTAGRAGVALRWPGLFVGGRSGGGRTIAAGATSPIGVVGAVRGGLELAAQIREGLLPRPDRLYLPWGTGGTAVGLSIGLALAGEPLPIRAVAAVERIFATRWQLAAVQRGTLKLLARRVGGLPDGFAPAPIELVHGHVGRAYGYSTPASCGACDRVRPHGLRLEPVYGGKAFCALLDDARRGDGGRILYWLTSHRGELPAAEGWRERLPPRLVRDLDRARSGKGPSRRGALLGGAAVAAGLLVVTRTTGYRDEDFADWQGEELAGWEAQVLAAAAEAVIPDEAGPLPAEGPSLRELVANVDRYLASMPAPTKTEIHGLMILLEQGTVIGGRLRRLTNLDPAARRGFLEGLRARGGLLGVAARGVRDLCYVGWYQDPRTWPPLGYGGPIVKQLAPGESPRETVYDALVAPPGESP
jgi:D-cysteine desulfhydrase